MPELYNDDDPSCYETSLVLRVMHPELDFDYTSEQLGLSPSWTRHKHDPRKQAQPALSKNIWALDSEGVIESRDLRRHIDWLINQLDHKTAALEQLRRHGYEIELCCIWARLGETGGPTLSVRNLQGLAQLQLELSFEFWSVEGEEEPEQ